VGQVWLTGGDINQTNDPTPILLIKGTADKDGDVRTFDGKVTIGSNRLTPGTAATPSPICKQRIVTPIPTTVVLEDAGSLRLVIDPRALFVNVDFSTLEGSDTYFTDDSSTQASRNLYQNLHAAGFLYRFEWNTAP
jgi:hypothetical protein